MNTRTNNISSNVRNILSLVAAATVMANPAMAQEKITITSPASKAQIVGKAYVVSEIPVVIDDPIADPRFVIADFDRSGKVDAWDLYSFYTHWVYGKEDADVNGDGIVDALDVYLFLNCWMSAASGGGGGSGSSGEGGESTENGK